ncbi:DUF1674 domain-containing protein [Algihabitans albus]|uniref:DUF1674 domain-containing protein n=1 Tax=Algihabitans albus TaxID=2164067 RepID=UPI000E5C726A|nr:succinate dehydrogenase assembly factor 4 [Algihabitans albus]
MFDLFKSHRPRNAKPPKRAPEAPQAKRRVARADLDRAEAEAKSAEQRQAGEGEAGSGKVEELGGPNGPEPTRYGDWERKGICYDF